MRSSHGCRSNRCFLGIPASFVADLNEIWGMEDPRCVGDVRKAIPRNRSSRFPSLRYRSEAIFSGTSTYRLTDMAQVIVRSGKGRELVSTRWSLIPAWWKGKGDTSPKPFNAREETVETLPSFKGSFLERRCIIPATGFLEWTGRKEDSIPHLLLRCG